MKTLHQSRAGLYTVLINCLIVFIIANAIVKATNNNGAIIDGQYYTAQNIIENQDFYYQLGWIPMGVYYDLMDNTNIPPDNPAENWDRIQGITLHDIFNIFDPSIFSMCEYYNRFVQLHQGTIPLVDMFDLFNHHNAI